MRNALTEFKKFDLEGEGESNVFDTVTHLLVK